MHGACVDDNFVINRLLSKNLNKEVLNLGIQGHGPLMQLAALKEYGLEKNPNCIMVLFWSNDLANLVDEAIKYEFINYLKDDYIQNLKENKRR